jgi:hypothetical protein
MTGVQSSQTVEVGSFLKNEVFNLDQEELEIFDKDFPCKEKLVTDTQLP